MKTYIPISRPIHAIEFVDTPECVKELRSVLKNAEFFRDSNADFTPYLIYYSTFGNKIAMLGDYICRDNNGNYYTVNKRTFESMYVSDKSWFKKTLQEFFELTAWQKIAVMAIMLVCLATLALILNLSKDLANLNLARDLLEDCRFTPEEQLQWNKF